MNIENIIKLAAQFEKAAQDVSNLKYVLGVEQDAFQKSINTQRTMQETAELAFNLNEILGELVFNVSKPK